MTNNKIETGLIVRDVAGASYIVKEIHGDGMVLLRGKGGIVSVHYSVFHDTYTVVC